MRLLMVMASVGLMNCGGGPSDEGESDESGGLTKQCERVRDHLVDLRLADATGVDRAAHKEAMQRALGAAFIDHCSNAMTTAQIDCVLDGADSSTAAACGSSTKH